MYDKFQTIASELKTEFFERDNIINAALIAILSGSHMLQLGMPGTAKSAITNAICRRIVGAKYFERLLTRFSTPEELFGPPSLKGIENDEYRRITDDMLPDAHIGFIDEIFKGNSSILNSLLTIINERQFDNGTTRMKTPLISMFGASNEMPDGEELDALYDRFLLRFNVPYIQDGSNWESLIRNSSPCSTVGNYDKTTITLDELNKAQLSVSMVGLQDSIIQTMYDIKMTLEREGIVASDRRWKQTINVLKANAWLRKSNQIEVQDLELLCDMLWREPTQRTILVSKIMSVTNPLNLQAIQFLDDCSDVYSKFDPSSTSSQQEVALKLRHAMEKIDEILRFADELKSDKMKETRTQIAKWYKTVISSMDV